MENELLSYFEEIISNKGLSPEDYFNLYNEGKNQELFEKCIQDDLLEIVEWLYLNQDVKFYLDNYLKNIDKDLLEEINSQETVKCYKVQYSRNDNKSYQILLEYRKYSKMIKDEKGFYYIYNKRKI